jgi:hypothetical protein
MRSSLIFHMSRILTFATVAFLGFAAPGAATAQQQPASTPSAVPPKPSAAAAQRTGPIQIDGRLDEDAWQAATPITSFTQLDPDEGQPASERTEARVLIDGDAIYVGVRAYDSEPGAIQSQLARRDEGVDGDIVEVMIDSYHDHITAYLFRLTPAGARRDAAVTGGGNSDNSWDAVWEGRTTIDAEGWSAEFRIPLSQLRYDPSQVDHVWGLQIGRKIARKAEVAFWSFTPKNAQGGVHRYGHLTGLGKLPSPRRLEVAPYMLAKTENPTVAPGDPFRRQNQVVPTGGIDVKYGITSNLTLDVTVNPDFGQVEVDPAVVNLSAFETFYPERRPFFVEGAGIFRFGAMRTNNTSGGYNFIHTRRIGRSPQRSLWGPGVQFVDAPLETSIAGAAKLTGRSASGWSVGILDAVTTRESGRRLLADGATERGVVEPLANYFVGRLKRDMRQGNTTVGGALSTVHRSLDDDLIPFYRSAAYVGGVDWQHAWGNRTWAFDGAVLATHNLGSAQAIDALQLSPSRYYQRPDRRSNFRDSTRTSLSGHAVEATFAKIAGRHWRGSLTYQEFSPGFEVNEGGFLGSTDMRSLASLIQYSENQPGKYLRNWSQFLFWNPTWNFDNDVTFNGVGSMSIAELNNFWNVSLRLDWRPPVTDDRLTRGGPQAVLTTQTGAQLELNSDRRKPHTYGIYVSRYTTRVGSWAQTVSPRLSLRPSSAMRVSLSPTYNHNRAVGQYVTRITDPTATNTFGSRHVFATMDQRQLSMVTRVDWTFTPALSLQVFAQPLLAAGDFHDYKEFTTPKAVQFAVYGRDVGTISRSDAGIYTVDPDGAGPADSFTFSERDFNQRSLRGNAVLRWEYRPGSALFFVWQQRRFGFEPVGEFAAGRNIGDLFATKPENVFLIKGTWWMGW